MNREKEPGESEYRAGKGASSSSSDLFQSVYLGGGSRVKRFIFHLPHRPILLLFCILGWLFITEWITMNLLRYLPIKDPQLISIMDASILSLFWLPGGFLLLYYPLMAQLRASSRDKRERILLTNTIEQTSDVIVITDKEGKIEYVNPVFEKNTGFTRKEVIGKNPNILKSGKQDDAYYHRMWETISAGKIWKGHFINQKKDGTLFEEDATISPVFDNEGEITNFIAVKRDVTERIHLEAQLNKAQKMEAIGTLSGGIAHEFNNILTPILGYTELMQRKDIPEKEKNEYLAIIRKGVDRARNLVHQILQFSRQQEGKRHILEIKPIVKEVLKLLHSTFPSSLSITQELTKETAMVEASATQLHTTLMNLCVNARDAMPGGGKLRVVLDVVPAGKLPIAVKADAKGKYVRLLVQDTGIGMDEKTQSKIFDPFFSTKEVGKGTGLGLSTVYGIVEQHNGFIDVSSIMGEGSTFQIFLPAKSGPSLSERKKSAKAESGTESILLIDDEADILLFGERALSGLGYRITRSQESIKALELFRKSKSEIDLVICDLTMPGITGDKLVVELKKIRPDIPIILSSGYSQAVPEKTMNSLGIEEVLSKPYSVGELAQIVRRVLDKH